MRIGKKARLGTMRLLASCSTTLALGALLTGLPAPALAQSGTWNNAPAPNGNWNQASNWSPNGVPNGDNDIATFGLSPTTAVRTTAHTRVHSIVFNNGASAYTITSTANARLTIGGAGIVNNSGTLQNFVAGSTPDDQSGGGLEVTNAAIAFINSASAGTNTRFTTLANSPSARFSYGLLNFRDNATAGSAIILNSGASMGLGIGGRTLFDDNATAGNAQIITGGAIAGSSFDVLEGLFDIQGGDTLFYGRSTGGNAIFTTNGGVANNAGGGSVLFRETSTAGAGNFTNNGGQASGAGSGVLVFQDDSTGGTATIRNNPNAVAGGVADNPLIPHSGSVELKYGGVTLFFDNSNAGNAVITNVADLGAERDTGGYGGAAVFSASSSAGNATITNRGSTVSGARGGVTLFGETGRAGSATIIADGGTGGGGGGAIFFTDDTLGDTATIKLFGNGTLDISAHNAAGLSIGSLEGDGQALLGARNLSVGSNNASTTFAGALTDGGIRGGTGGSLTKIGSGTLTLTGASTYTGATNVSAGTLLVNGSLAGNVSVASGAALGGTGRMGAVSIASGGTLSPGGDAVGTLTLASLTLSAGSILRYDLGRPDVIGGTDNDRVVIVGNLVLDGILNVNARPDYGQGVYRLFDYGGTLTNEGLEIGSGAGARAQVQTVIAGQVNLVVGDALQFWDGGDTVADLNVDGGSGTWGNTATNWTRRDGDVNEAWGGGFAIFQATPGTVTIAADGVSASGLQFAVNGYTLTGGTLTLTAPASIRVGDGSAAGAGYSATISATIAGAAGLDKGDLGTLILSGANSYGGGTTISGGILQVGGDANLGAAAGGVTLNGGTLRFSAAASSARAFAIGASGGAIDAANSLGLSGAIGGSGALTKTGAGTLTLGGDSSAFAGALMLAGGSLRLDGSIGGTIAVNAGTRLGGTGTLNNANVAGTLAPGNSIGTLTAIGNVSFAAGSTFEVEVDPNGTTDRLLVTGRATLGGTVSALFLGNATGACGTTISSNILTAQGGISGTFAGVTTNYAFLTPSLSYDANNVRLTLSRSAATFSERGATANQRQSGAAAEALQCGNPLFGALVQLSAADARAAFEQISGEVHASTRGALFEDSRFVRDAMLTPRPARGLWGDAYGSWGRIDGDGNATGVERDGAGAFAGVDLPIGDNLSAGIGGGYSRADLDVGARASQANVASWHLAARASARFGGFGLAAGGAIAWHRFDIGRIVTFPGFAETADARYDGQTRQLFARIAYELPLGIAAIEPFAELAWVEVKTDAFAERGGAAALSGRARSEDQLISTLGARATARLGDVTLQGRLGWRHAFDAQASRAALAFGGGNVFTISGAPISSDQLVAEAGVDFALGGGARLGAGYRGQAGDRSRDHGARATFSMPF